MATKFGIWSHIFSCIEQHIYVNLSYLPLRCQSSLLPATGMWKHCGYNNMFVKIIYFFQFLFPCFLKCFSGYRDCEVSQKKCLRLLNGEARNPYYLELKIPNWKVCAKKGLFLFAFAYVKKKGLLIFLGKLITIRKRKKKQCTCILP